MQMIDTDHSGRHMDPTESGWLGPHLYTFGEGTIAADRTLVLQDGETLLGYLHTSGGYSSRHTSIQIAGTAVLTNRRYAVIFNSLPATAVDKGMGRHFQGVLYPHERLDRRERNAVAELAKTSAIACVFPLDDIASVTLFDAGTLNVHRMPGGESAPYLAVKPTYGAAKAVPFIDQLLAALAAAKSLAVPAPEASQPSARDIAKNRPQKHGYRSWNFHPTDDTNQPGTAAADLATETGAAADTPGSAGGANLPAAAWHDAPGEPGMLRWWDGTAWTDHRTPKQ